MKRRKDDEKAMGPMFPRLNVNDIEKVGPRAPPRNKMALYEQLSITSQRFNSNNDNTSSATSLNQGSEYKMPMFSTLHLPRSTPLGDNPNATSSDFNTSLAAPQKRLNEEDFTVPVFAQPENRQNKKNYSNDIETVPLSVPDQINRSSRNQSSISKERKQNSVTVSGLRREDGCQTRKLQCPFEDKEGREHLTNNAERIQSKNYVHNPNYNGEYDKDERGCSLVIQNGDRFDDDSDTSMLDSVSAVFITPDDVVGVIGQKHFWKARRAIVNQQRVFAVQVFELHRLIKVQKLFAGSPNLALEDSAFPGNAVKTSLPKQVALDFVTKLPVNIETYKENTLINHNEKTEKINAKKSLSSPQFVSHPSNQPPYSVSPQPPPVATEPSATPWYMNHPTGHHWLVPVMSPTEGLIYKPYPGPGPGPSHTESNPMMGNFSFPMPNSHPSMTHHGYFPPFAMAPSGSAFSGNQFMGANLNEQQQGSCSGPIQKKDNNFVKTRTGNESGLQISTASGPRGRNRPLADDVAKENVAKVIKVVPRDAVSATETAFRIFQSIQKEREQYDSV